MMLHRRVDKAMILAPERVARAAASNAARPEEARMPREPEAVHESYVAEVLEPGPPEGSSRHAAGPAPETLLAREPGPAPQPGRNPQPGSRPVDRSSALREP